MWAQRFAGTIQAGSSVSWSQNSFYSPLSLSPYFIQFGISLGSWMCVLLNVSSFYLVHSLWVVEVSQAARYAVRKPRRSNWKIFDCIEYIFSAILNHHDLTIWGLWGVRGSVKRKVRLSYHHRPMCYFNFFVCSIPFQEENVLHCQLIQTPKPTTPPEEKGAEITSSKSKISKIIRPSKHAIPSPNRPPTRSLNRLLSITLLWQTPTSREEGRIYLSCMGCGLRDEWNSNWGIRRVGSRDCYLCWARNLFAGSVGLAFYGSGQW